jgi:hypothetical protein
LEGLTLRTGLGERADQCEERLSFPDFLFGHAPCLRGLAR